MNWPTEITVVVVSSVFGLAVLAITLFFQAKKDRTDVDWRYAETFLQHEITHVSSLFRAFSEMHESTWRFIMSSEFSISRIVTYQASTQVEHSRRVSTARIIASPYLSEDTRAMLDEYVKVHRKILTKIADLAKAHSGPLSERLTEYSQGQREEDAKELASASGKVLKPLGAMLNPQVLRRLKHNR
jgi:hypothetical protein